MIVSMPYGVRPDGKTLIRTVSDQNKLIREAGTLELYEEAIDVAPVPQYEETDIDIETPDDETDEGATPAPEEDAEVPGDDIE